MAYNFIYKLFYVFLHTSFTIFEYSLKLFDYLRLKVTNHEFSHCYRKCDYLLKGIHKKPSHLTVLLSGEKPSYKDLANIIFWCLAAKITYVSFYDYKGTLHENREKLIEEINGRKQSEDHIIWQHEKHKNGYSGRKINVKIITNEDGRNSIVNLCKNILLSDKKIDYSIQSVNEALKVQFSFPDPELGLYCGDTFLLYSYPPWQIRVTEFLPIKTHHNITFDSFVNCLLRYSKCEQRLGK